VSETKQPFYAATPKRVMDFVDTSVIDAGTIRLHRGDRLPDEFPSPDVYFLPEYGRAAGIADGGEWLLVEAFEGAWQVPLIVRTTIDGAKDAISPTYSGVYASPSLSSSQVQEAWSATVNCLRELDVISVLLRHSPLVPQAPDLPGLRSIMSGNPTIVLEATDNDSAWSGMKSQCRNQVRKALKNGYTCHVRQAASQDLVPGGDFRCLYQLTMERLGAASVYFLSDSYFRELLNGLGSNLLIGEVRDPAGFVVNSTLLIRHAQRLHYHLLGSTPADGRMGSNNLMVWTAAQFAIAQGLRQFHLGGGITPRDSLFRFKHTFGGRELEYRVSGLIIDDDRYQAHTRSRAKACGNTAETLLNSNFFPAYRGGTTHV
jgi:hypothetical protein